MGTSKQNNQLNRRRTMSDEIKIFRLALNSLMAELDEIKKLNVEMTDRIIQLETFGNTSRNSMLDKETVDKEDTLLDTKQVRKILKISHNTLQAIVRSGKLKQIRINGRNIRYSKFALNDYLKSITQTI